LREGLILGRGYTKFWGIQGRVDYTGSIVEGYTNNFWNEISWVGEGGRERM